MYDNRPTIKAMKATKMKEKEMQNRVKTKDNQFYIFMQKNEAWT
jgi:hypothetical protein